MPIQLACPGADAATWEGQTYPLIPATVCVFDLPTSSAGLLAFPILGWRWPLPDDWGTVDPATYVSPLPADPVPDPSPEPVPVPSPVAPVDPTPEPEPAPVDPTPEPVAVTAPAEPEPETTDDDDAGSVPEQLVALALAAGKDGLSTAAAYSACGKAAYTALGRLAADGRLVKAGRGLYQHPDVLKGK